MSAKITEADCAQILSKYFKGKPPKVTSFSLAPISDEVGNGFMGNHLLLRINIENGELRFFAKTSPSEQDPTAAFIREGNMFNKEVYCYKFLEKVKNEFPEFEASFVPQYYFSKDDEVLILEDLGSSGYEPWSEEGELDLDHIKLGLAALAKFHVASLIFEEMKSQELGRKYFLLEEYSKWLEENIYSEDENYDGYKYMQTGVKALCALTEVAENKFLTSSDFKEKILSLTKETYEKIKPSQKFRNVWCHGDVWIKNMLFKYQNGVPVDCKIFDFQMTRYNPPAHDVLYMLYENVSTKWRQQYFHTLLDFYYLNLKSELEKHYLQIENIFSKDELELSARELFPVNILSKSIYKTISGMSSEALKEVMSDPKFYHEFNYTNRDEFVLKIFQNEEPYRKLMTSMLHDIEDVLVYEKVTVEECFKIVNKALGSTQYEIINTTTTHFRDTLSKFEILIRRGSQSEILSFLIKDQTPADQKFLLNDTSNEVEFYKMITSTENESNLIKHCVPRCFLYRENDITICHDYYTKSYKSLSSTLDDYKSVKVVMKKLAQFHAGGFILKQQHQQNECFKFDDAESLKYVIRECLIQQGKSKLKLELFDNYISKILEEATKYAQTSLTHKSVCHGNLLSENILFKLDDETPVKCIFVNFEDYHWGPPAFDFLLFFHLSTSRKFRHQYMKEFLEVYYGEMTTTLKIYNVKVEDVLPHAKFVQDCTKLKPLAISRSLLYYYNIVMFSKEDNKFSLKKQLNDDSSDSIHRLQECVADIKSLCKG